MLQFAACLVVFLLIASPVRGEVEFQMPADMTYGYGSTSRESMQLQLKLTPEFRFRSSTSSTLVSSFRIRLDPSDHLEPGEAPRDSYSPLSNPLALASNGVAEIRDLYIEKTLGTALLRIGKQQIVWGQLDGIKVLDVLNPQDFREFIMEDFGESRISLWSAYLDGTLGAWRTEVAVIPDGTGHVIPNPGAWFELEAPRFRFGAAPGQPGLPTLTRRPGNDLDSTAVGLRLSRTLGRIDVSAVAYSGLDPEPLGRLVTDGGEAAVERYFERRDVVGLSAETGIGNWVIRGEYAYQPDRIFNVRTPMALGAEKLDQHRIALGWDLSLPGSVFVNAQFLLDTIDSAPATLVRPAVDRIATLFVRKSFGYDRVRLEGRWYHSFTDEDDLVSLSLAFSTGSNTEIRLRGDAFSGSNRGLFGQFAPQDRIVVGVEHVF